MAGDWVKMRTDLYRDPKVCLIADALMDKDAPLARYVNQHCQRDMTVTRNVTRNVTVGALVAVWGVMRTRGRRVGDDLLSPGASLAVLDDVSDIPGFGVAMASVGWAVESPDGVVFPRFFSEFNVDPVDEKKAKAAERQRRYRDKQAENRDVTSASRVTSQSNAREEKRREEKSIKSKEKINAGEAVADEPEVFVAPRAFCVTPGITSIEIDGNVIEYHENAWSWEAEFVRRWNLLPKVNKRTSSSLDETLRKALQQRLMDVSWFWKRAMGLFPLPTDLEWTPTLTWFLKPDSVSKILDGNFQRVTKRKPARSAEDDEFVSFTEEELSK